MKIRNRGGRAARDRERARTVNGVERRADKDIIREFRGIREMLHDRGAAAMAISRLEVLANNPATLNDFMARAQDRDILTIIELAKKTSRLHNAALIARQSRIDAISWNPDL